MAVTDHLTHFKCFEAVALRHSAISIHSIKGNKMDSAPRANHVFQMGLMGVLPAMKSARKHAIITIKKKLLTTLFHRRVSVAACGYRDATYCLQLS